MDSKQVIIFWIFEYKKSEEKTQNLMFEKRVVRGNTYARIITSKDTEVKTSTLGKSGKSTKKTIQIVIAGELHMPYPFYSKNRIVNLWVFLWNKQQKEQVEYQRDTFEPGTPKPVSGRQNIEVQTDEFVETLTDKPPEYEKDT